jgi:hypothetical protein
MKTFQIAEFYVGLRHFKDLEQSVKTDFKEIEREDLAKASWS